MTVVSRHVLAGRSQLPHRCGLEFETAQMRWGDRAAGGSSTVVSVCLWLISVLVRAW